MKILELIWVILLVILSVLLTIWQIIIKSPLFPICFLGVMSIIEIILLIHILKEFNEEKR